MGKISDSKPAASCSGCFAWGQLPGRFCRGCYTYGQQHAVGACVGCRRQVPVDDKYGYCRLCRAQATWAIKASGKASVIEPYLRQVACQQLFFANLQRPKNGGPRVGKAGRRVLKPPPLPEPHRVITTSTQLTLFTATRDFRRFDRELHADLANPWLIRAQQAARALGEARGWSRWITSDVNRALVIVLSGFREGESIRYSELFPALRVRGLPVVRTAEVLNRLGLFADDRAPAVDQWLERKLGGCPEVSVVPSKPGFARSSTVARGPGLAPGTRHGPTWVRPSRCCWSGPAATTTCEKSPGKTSSRPATMSPANSAKAGSSPCGLCSGTRRRTARSSATPRAASESPGRQAMFLQALAQSDIDEAIATAATPDIRLIVALAAIHAARPKMIRTMQLDDVDLGNRRITVGGHVRPLDDFTHRAVLDWLDHRRSRWPNTANPHLLITQKTAVELGPAGKLWTTRATRNLTATLERLRVDRQLEEALTHGADPLHLALVFGIDEKTAIRYADSARQLLQAEIEAGVSPR